MGGEGVDPRITISHKAFSLILSNNHTIHNFLSDFNP